MSDQTTDWLGEPSDGERPDPVRAARGHAKPALPRRFYTEAGFSEDADGFRLTLDGRPANTPARNPLQLPSRTLAERVAAEWATQEAVIDPARMPLTRLANTAIDGVTPRMAAVAADLCAYAGTDLLAYRAGDPDRLVAAQAAAWDPILAWARDEFGARVILSEGVMHVAQPADTIQALSAAVTGVTDPFQLTGLHTLTTLTGSLLIALAVLRGRLTPAEAWAAAHVDETFQAAVWGRDAEAEARLETRRTEFEAAAAFVGAGG
ncbi:Chaperone required for the assembly of the F1-ATPase [Methylobacterium sp. UNC378MF]|uniref:ATP12 family chaperone protein n=1 Tax=Methylobacterium sp. UNC378MF TaxID=1502748 RepID=UPI00088FD8F6|nr:ATP12 family protein [Methylobacterium sp. UNC378MF]SDA20596.1 Chaperone required for the assembly of the F1-ATPase [Methylobacterium sp. UNC378MF]